MVRKIAFQRGSMLVNVLLLMFFLGAMAFAASSMITTGAQTTTSSLRYQEVDWAAEYALNKGIKEALDNECTVDGAQKAFGTSESTYVISATQSPNEKFCFIRVEGQLQHNNGDPQSTVVKTVTLPVQAGDGNGGKALATKGLGSNLTANGNHIVIESECVGLSYETCAWCNNPNKNQEEFLEKIDGTPDVAVEEFKIGNFFTQPTDDDVIDALEQETLAKIDELIKDGKDQCVYRPTDWKGNLSRQGKNCNTEKKGKNVSLSCTQNGGNKIIDFSKCDEIAIYAESVNINHDIPASTKVFASVGNNLNITKSVTGVLSSDGVLNISLSGNENIDGVFVGRTANNLNLSGTNAAKGVLAYLDQSNLTVNLNGGGNTEQVLCGTMIANGNVNFSRNGHARIKYCEDEINKWQADTSILQTSSCNSTATIMTNAVDKTRYRAF